MIRSYFFQFCLLPALLLSFAVHSLWAGDIRVAVSATTRVTGKQAVSYFQLRNEGNETAWNIAIAADLPPQRQSVFVGEKLAPAETKTVRIAFELPPGAQGTFPIFAELKYHDHAGRSFSNAALAVAATATFSPPPLRLTLGHSGDFSRDPLRLDVAAPPGSVADVVLTCHVPAAIAVRPRVNRLNLENGRAGADFRLARTEGAAPGSSYEAFFTATYAYQGIQYLAYASVALPVDALPDTTVGFRQAVSEWSLVIFLLAALVAGVLWFLLRWRRGVSCSVGAGGSGVFDLLAIAAAEIFILAKLSPQDLLTATIATGGDMASHYYTLDYLVHNLLPSGRISGWNPGNYAGFPLLQLYFPLPFLLMALLGAVMPLTVAFKLGTLAGTMLLPPAMYFLLRSLRCPFPGPAIGAVLSLPFLFNNGQSMWGGNLLSTLAGEFAYSLSLSLSLILLGSLYREMGKTRRRVVVNAFLVFLVGFSHGYTLIFAGAASLFFLITTEGFFPRLRYLLKVYGLAFLLMAFWLAPLLANLSLTTPFAGAWVINSLGEIAPLIILPVFAAAILGTLGLLIVIVGKRRKQMGEIKAAHFMPAAFLWFACLVAGLLYLSAPGLGLIDIRYLPCAQLMLCAVAAYCLGCLGRFLPKPGLSLLYLLVVAGATILWTNGRTGAVSDWAKWNYTGFEAKYAWPLFREINQGLRGTFQDPRVVYEHAAAHNDFGSIRAFESLPLFSGRATLEGLYLQASPSAPFVFAIQSEISREQSCPFRQFGCTVMDYGRARRHLEMFNVRELILRSPEAKAAIGRYPEYRRLRSHGDYEVWELNSRPHSYVTPLRRHPVLYCGKNWKNDVYRWFLSAEDMDIHWVYDPSDASGSCGTAHDLTAGSGERFPVKFGAAAFASAEGLKNIRTPPIATEGCRIRETIREDEIIIDTNWIDKPLLIKVSYHPNWRVEGADRIYRVSPAFMLVYPRQERVRLHYGAGWPDRLGLLMTGGALLILAALPFRKRSRESGRAASGAARGAAATDVSCFREIPPARRRIFLAAGWFAAAAGIAVLCFNFYVGDPHRWFNEAVRLRDQRQFEEARTQFRRVLDKVDPVSGLANDSRYHIGISYYLEGKLPQAIQTFEKLTTDNPRGSWAPEAQYHIGLCYLQQGKAEAGAAQMRRIIENYPYSAWAGHARRRLAEQAVTDHD